MSTNTSVDSTDSGISTVHKFKQLVFNQHGSKELQQMWIAVYKNDIETANRLCKEIGKKPYKGPERAVRGLVFKICWYSHYDMFLIKKVLQHSAFEPNVHYNPEDLGQIRQEAMERHDDTY